MAVSIAAFAPPFTATGMVVAVIALDDAAIAPSRWTTARDFATK